MRSVSRPMVGVLLTRSDAYELVSRFESYNLLLLSSRAVRAVLGRATTPRRDPTRAGDAVAPYGFAARAFVVLRATTRLLGDVVVAVELVAARAVVGRDTTRRFSLPASCVVLTTVLIGFSD